MRTLCIWGETRADVLDGYSEVAKLEDAPQRITWRLTAAFDGKPVGNNCYAPNNPEIREAYGEVIPQVEEPAVYADEDEDEE